MSAESIEVFCENKDKLEIKKTNKILHFKIVHRTSYIVHRKSFIKI